MGKTDFKVRHGICKNRKFKNQSCHRHFHCHLLCEINKAADNFYFEVASLRYAIKSTLSDFFLIPAKIIFVPGMYFFGFSKYSIRVSSPQVIPGKKIKKTGKKTSGDFKVKWIHLFLVIHIILLSTGFSTSDYHQEPPVAQESCFTFTFVLIGICVREALSLSCFASKQAMKVGSSLVLASFFNRMALGTFLDKNLLALLNISHCQY